MQTQEDIIKNQARCISHEIRNQLSVCNIYCDIIKKHLEKNNIRIPSVDEALDCIRKSSTMIGNSLLDLKSLNNYSMKYFDLNSLIQQSVDMGRVYLLDKNIDIFCEPVKNICVKVDDNKFIACLLNLIKNAVEAIPIEGFINIKTEYCGDYAYIKISNNGAKIPPEFVDKIFVKGETSKALGCGLGLYICKSNLNFMGGDLELVQSTDEITEFKIVIPVYKI